MKSLCTYIKVFLCVMLLAGCDQRSSDDTLEVDPELQAQLAYRSVIEIATNYGTIRIELFDDIAPLTVANFTQYVESGFYDNTLVHQVLPGFMIQAGLFDIDFIPKDCLEAIANEAAQAPKHARGTVAMMRNQHPDSAKSEFFINLADNEQFDIPNGYAVFGQVTEGLEILDAIGELPTCSGGPFYDDVPCAPVVIEQVSALS